MANPQNLKIQIKAILRRIQKSSLPKKYKQKEFSLLMSYKNNFKSQILKYQNMDDSDSDALEEHNSR